MSPEVELAVIITAGLLSGFIVVILAETAQLLHRFGVLRF